MRKPKSAPRCAALAFALTLLAAAAVTAQQEAPGQDLRKLDLSGDWYVLVHYKDDRSEDKSITKFKDFAWSIEQTANTMTWEQYPYVMFDEDTELNRRHAMREHLAWQPEGSRLAALRRTVDVSSRAMTRKRMTGSVGEGFKSLPPLASGGFNTMTFTRNWDVRFEPQQIKIVVTDSLSGGGGLEGMEESIVYSVKEIADDGELRGSYDEENKHGSFRMLRSAERRVVK